MHPGRPPDLFREVIYQSISIVEESYQNIIIFLCRTSPRIERSNLFYEKTSSRALFSSFNDFGFFSKIKPKLSCLKGQQLGTNDSIFLCIHLRTSTEFKNSKKKHLWKGLDLDQLRFKVFPFSRHLKSPSLWTVIQSIFRFLPRYLQYLQFQMNIRLFKPDSFVQMPVKRIIQIILTKRIKIWEASFYSASPVYLFLKSISGRSHNILTWNWDYQRGLD